MRIKTAKIRWLVPALALLCIGWADSWEQVKTTADSVTSVQAEFVQEKHLPILARPLVSKGVFYYQAPRSLRWEYRWPVQSILSMHDGRVRRFVSTDGAPGFREESGAGLEAMQVVMGEITQWLAGRFDDNPMFQTHLEAGRRIVLVPKDDAFQKVIRRIVLNLSQQPGVMQSVVIYESEDAFTQLTFSKTVINAKIEDTLFQKIP
ncbi:MAG: outer membrane lipoprotein carrier protein LolA [Salinivirgaceae bacterium]|nr:outer membrane lipoprotein carrier protein LolA [Salinivirgaceae bacterium]